jgi:hypothetical protein
VNQTKEKNPMKKSSYRLSEHPDGWLCPLHEAAPALLEALEDLLDLGRAGFIQGSDIAVTRAVEAARAAIAKAKDGAK